ncbi:MAG: hypothetical protein IAI50_08800 [Candidatus Eremiobacteraeota bacterium]|nr:hypothetical protein [Candidatus Eremiobacteraeota bacterium]
MTVMFARIAFRIARVVSFAMVLTGSAQAITQSRSVDRHVIMAEPGKQIYLSDFYHNTIDVYPEAGYFQKPSDKITAKIDGPLGLCVDKNGDLYVANGNDGTVPIFHRGAVTPYRILTEGQPRASGVAVDSKGNVYVVGSNDHTVYVYAPGATQPSRTLTDSHQYVRSIAIDKSDDIFLGSQKQIDEIPAGSTVPRIIDIVTYDSVGGFAIRSDGLLAVSVENSIVAMYAPPYNRQTLKSSFFVDGFLGAIAFVPGQDRIWVANSTADVAQSFTFSGELVGQTATGSIRYVYGLAVDPAAP